MVARKSRETQGFGHFFKLSISIIASVFAKSTKIWLQNCFDLDKQFEPTKTTCLLALAYLMMVLKQLQNGLQMLFNLFMEQQNCVFFANNTKKCVGKSKIHRSPLKIERPLRENPYLWQKNQHKILQSGYGDIKFSPTWGIWSSKFSNTMKRREDKKCLLH